MQAHKTFHISRSTIDDWLRLREQTGSVQDIPSAFHGGRRGLGSHENFAAFAQRHQHSTLEQMCQAWQQETQQKVSMMSFSRALRQHSYTRKKRVSSTASVPRAYRERRPAQRQLFAQRLEAVAVEDRVYVDEAGVEDTLEYAYGWSFKGTRCWGERLGHRRQRVSMMAAWCAGEVIAPLTFEGYCDSVLVEAWFEQQLCPVLRAGQVVILDNASFHRKKQLRVLLERVGCSLLALPAYSPDLNRIEPLWNTLKHHIKMAPDPHLSLQQKVDAAFCSL